MKLLLYKLLLFSLNACTNAGNNNDMSENSDTASETSNAIIPKIEYTFEIPNNTTKNFYVTIYPQGSH
jgi:hypothetical protein